MKALIDKINKLKKSKNAIILAHCYQKPEIDFVADYVGDSLNLSQIAAKTDADIIVFAGVYFMAQTAKLLSPNKKVLLPNIKSGCQMADMVNVEKLREFKSKHPNIPTVCYINTTAEVKAECDICVTSSNAIKVVKSLNADKILFLPDVNLGNWVEKNCDGVEVIKYFGYCPTHMGILKEDILKIKQENPNAKVLIHPECLEEVLEEADFVGSTTQIIDYCKNSKDEDFVIGTEFGVLQRLVRDFPDKNFTLASKRAVCKEMKYNSLEDILYVLETEKNNITVPEDIIEKAVQPIQRMLDVK